MPPSASIYFPAVWRNVSIFINQEVATCLNFDSLMLCSTFGEGGRPLRLLVLYQIESLTATRSKSPAQAILVLYAWNSSRRLSNQRLTLKTGIFRIYREIKNLSDIPCLCNGTCTFPLLLLGLGLPSATRDPQNPACLL